MTQLIGAAILMLSALPTPTSPPLRLETSVTAGAVTFRVLGLSAKAVHARYSLQVAAGSGNRSTHGGTVTLRPDAPVTISTISVSVAPDGKWSATLRVEPEGAPAYEVTSANP